MHKLLFTALFSMCLSGLVSGWVTYINLGLGAGFIKHWGLAYLNAWPMAFLTAYVLAAPINALTKKLFKESSS